MPSFIDVMGFDDNLSNEIIKAAVKKESKDKSEPETEKLTMMFGKHEESVNSKVMEYILRGRIPDKCSLLDFGRRIIQGQLEQMDTELKGEMAVKEEMKVDAVVMIIPRGCKTLPKKLIKSVRQETKRKDLSKLHVHIL